MITCAVEDLLSFREEEMSVTWGKHSHRRQPHQHGTLLNCFIESQNHIMVWVGSGETLKAI